MLDVLIALGISLLTEHCNSRARKTHMHKHMYIFIYISVSILICQNFWTYNDISNWNPTTVFILVFLISTHSPLECLSHTFCALKPSRGLFSLLGCSLHLCLCTGFLLWAASWPWTFSYSFGYYILSQAAASPGGYIHTYTLSI